MKTSLILTLALSLFGCASSKVEKAVTPLTDPTRSDPEPKEPQQPPSVPSHSTDSKPTSADRVQAWLMARHADDLPSQEQLATMDDAAESLVWVSRTAKHLGTRARAFSLMRFYSSAPVRSRLLSVLQDSSTHAKLLAAAIQGTEAIDLGADAELKAALDGLKGHQDPRVIRALSTRLTR